MDILIFTLGLTEVWKNAEIGVVFPTAPGVVAGTFNEAVHRFQNLNIFDNLAAFEAFKEELSDLRGGRPVKYILTVSPVPLTATASGNHVLVATTYSKSVLRSVAGYLADRYDNIDYFPSFEIVTNQANRGAFYENNLRSVRKTGVETVMKVFFAEHALPAVALAKTTTASPRNAQEDLACEEAMLEAFRP